MRTVFNLLGPLANPARAQAQVIGAPSHEGARLMAEALAELGTRHAFVVHGHDGLDEISICGATEVYEIRGGGIRRLRWTPEDFGVSCAPMELLIGGGPEFNAEIARSGDFGWGEWGSAGDCGCRMRRRGWWRGRSLRI